MSKSVPRGSRPATTVRPFTPPLPVLALVVVALVVFAHRHVLDAFFALDDLILFQQAAGVRAWPETPWRWLSGIAWFRAVVPMWAHEPLPYHLASLALHLVNAGLLFVLARRWGAGPLAAMVGATLFGISRLHFPALLAATSVGELLALGLALSAVLVAGTGPRAWWAAALMALAVSAKESVMLVPLAALLAPGPEGGSRSRTLGPALVTGFVVGIALLVNGMGSGRLGGPAYSVAFGGNLLDNAARLVAWSFDLVSPIPESTAPPTGALRVALPLLALALTVFAWRARSTPLLAVGALWWWLALVFVLPLPGRVYLHYLYTPLAGLALVAAGFVQWAVERRGVGKRAWAVAGIALLAFTLWNDVSLSTRVDLRMEAVDWPLDPVLRKSEIARRSIGDVRRVLGGARSRVAILIPASLSRNVGMGSGRVLADTLPVQRYELEAVLDGGASLRAFVPEAESVVFVHDFESGRDGWRYLISRTDAHLVDLGTLPGAHLRVVEAMIASGLPAAALDYAERALVHQPDDTAMRSLRDRAAAAALQKGTP